MPLTIDQAATLALAIYREMPSAMDHHIVYAVETVSEIFDDFARETGDSYDFNTAVDRGCDFAQDAIDRDARDVDFTFVDDSYLRLVGA